MQAHKTKMQVHSHHPRFRQRAKPPKPTHPDAGSAQKPDTDRSLEAGLPDVISIVAAMLWSNHCDHPLPEFKKEKKEQKETQKIFSSTSVQNYGWMQQ